MTRVTRSTQQDRARARLAPRYGLDQGLAATVGWYIDNQDWCRRASAAIGKSVWACPAEAA